MDNIFSFLNNQEMNYIFMEIRQLEYFRAIVDAGTISGAARVLHMTQPPLSYQMKMLEEELQVSKLRLQMPERRFMSRPVIF